MNKSTAGIGAMRVRSGPSRVALLVALSVVGICSAGCGLDLAYLLPAAVGQLNLVVRAVPLEQALADGSLSEEKMAKLALIRDAREYARDVVGLNVSGNFTKFYDSGDQAVLFNVSAAQKDALVPKVWSFPIVGTVPYLGFFDRSRADAKFEELKNDGLDVFMYQVDAFSGLGVIPTLVLSPMLDRPDFSLTDTVFHELLHSTVWRTNDTPFNESLATFVGRTAARQFYAERYPENSDIVIEAFESFDDSIRYVEAMQTLLDNLDTFYASDLTREEKIEGRDAIFQTARDHLEADVVPLMNQPERYDWVQNIPTSNAWLLSIRRYNLDLDVFEQVFERTGQDWATSLDLFDQASDSDDPYEFLRDWLTSTDLSAKERS